LPGLGATVRAILGGPDSACDSGGKAAWQICNKRANQDTPLAEAFIFVGTIEDRFGLAAA